MKIRTKLVLSAAVALGAVLTLSACSTNSGSTTGSRAINLNIYPGVATLDSGIATDTYSFDVIGNTEEGLTRVDANGAAQNALAKSIDVSKDGLTYTITLRDNLYWTTPDGKKGDKLTAKDFVYAWQRNDDPKTASQYAYLLSYIHNAADINAGKKPITDLGVKATSDTELVVTLDEPTPFFKFLLAEGVYFPLDQKVVEQYGKEYGTTSSKMVYSGPYYFKTTNGWTGTNNAYSIYKNPNYYDASAVKSQQINFQLVADQAKAVQLYKQGKLDSASIATAELYKIYKNNKDKVLNKEATTLYVEMNQSGKGASSPDAQKALKNLKIRQALSLVINRTDFNTQFYPASSNATGLVPAGMAKTSTGEDFAKYAAQPYTYNLTKAKELWAEGMKEIGLTKLTLNWESDAGGSTAQPFADYFAKSFEQLPGLTVNEKVVQFQQRLKDSQTQNFDLVSSLWGGDYAEPTTFLNLFTTGAPYNNGQFSNAAYDKAMKAATTTDVLDPAKRDADYKAAEQALYDEANIIPVTFRVSPGLHNPNYVGSVFHSTGLTIDLKNAYIK